MLKFMKLFKHLNNPTSVLATEEQRQDIFAQEERAAREAEEAAQARVEAIRKQVECLFDSTVS